MRCSIEDWKFEINFNKKVHITSCCDQNTLYQKTYKILSAKPKFILRIFEGDIPLSLGFLSG